MLREDNEIKIEQLQNDEKSYGTLSYEMENN